MPSCRGLGSRLKIDPVVTVPMHGHLIGVLGIPVVDVPVELLLYPSLQLLNGYGCLLGFVEELLIILGTDGCYVGRKGTKQQVFVVLFGLL